MFQTWSWTFCETVSYKSTFRRSKQQHSRMQIMTQLRVLSMRIAEVPGPCETPAIQSQQDSLFPGKWNGSSVVDSRSFSHRMFSNLALVRCLSNVHWGRALAGGSDPSASREAGHPRGRPRHPRHPRLPTCDTSPHGKKRRIDESTGHATRRIAHQRGWLCARMDSDRQIWDPRIQERSPGLQKIGRCQW